LGARSPRRLLCRRCPAALVVTVLRLTLRTLGWGAGGLLVVVFAIGYAAPFLSPTHFWWADLFAVVLPFSSMGVAALALGLCGWGGVRRRWGRVAFGGALLVLLVVRFGGGIAAWGPAGPEGTSLRLMTLNLPSAFDGGSRSSEEALAALVRREQPDLLALQESRIETGAAEGRGATRRVSSTVQTLLDGSGGYAPPRILPPSTVIQQPVLGRLPIDSLSVHRLPPDGKSNPRDRFTRVRFAWQGRPVVLYNLHLHSVGRARPWTMLPEEWTSVERWNTFLASYREGALRRAQQARLVRRQIERESDPVIVVGDFNSTPHQWAYRHLAQGLQSAVTRRVRGWGATFPAQYPLVQIDHVLIDPALQITAARIPVEGSTALSDHRPVVAHVRWKGQ